MHPVLCRVIEVAETGRAGALAQRAAAAAGALAAASLRITGRGIAAFGALVASRLRAFAAVAGSMLRMFAGEFHASMLRVVAYACALAAMALLGLEFVTPPHGSVAADAQRADPAGAAASEQAATTRAAPTAHVHAFAGIRRRCTSSSGC